MRLLLTRPADDAARTRAALLARGHDVMLAPLLSVVPVPVAIGERSWRESWDAVIFTSANACRAVAATLAGGDANHPRLAALLTRPAYVVGGRTAAAARAAGFTRIESADGDADALLRLIATHFKGPGKADARLLYLAGEDRAADIAAALAPEKIAVETVSIYKAEAATGLPDDVLRALAAGAIGGVLHFSGRSAQAYLRCAGMGQAAALAPVQFCLSPRIAAVVKEAGARRIAVAARPDEAALLDLIENA
jgi:uroporphyrinogen-III synthase